MTQLQRSLNDKILVYFGNAKDYYQLLYKKDSSKALSDSEKKKIQVQSF